jgi:hypothetical protein
MTPADYKAAKVLKALQSILSEEPKTVETSPQHFDYDVLPYDEFDLGNQHNSVTRRVVNSNSWQYIARKRHIVLSPYGECLYYIVTI